MFASIALVGILAAAGGEATPAKSDASEAGSMTREGDFGLMVAATCDPEGFLAQWRQPDKSGFLPHLRRASTARRGDDVVFFVFFGGCKANEVGDCDAIVDIVLRRPDGSVYEKYEGLELWQEKPALPRGNMQLSVGNMALTIENTDPVGRYRCTAVATDRVAGITVQSETFVSVVDAR